MQCYLIVAQKVRVHVFVALLGQNVATFALVHAFSWPLSRYARHSQSSRTVANSKAGTAWILHEYELNPPALNCEHISACQACMSTLCLKGFASLCVCFLFAISQPQRELLWRFGRFHSVWRDAHNLPVDPIDVPRRWSTEEIWLHN